MKKKQPEYLYLNKNYRISADSECWILQKGIKTKKGGVNWTNNNSFHATLNQLFDKLTDEIIKEHWFDIEAIKKGIEEVKQFVKQLNNDLNQISGLYITRNGRSLVE